VEAEKAKIEASDLTFTHNLATMIGGGLMLNHGADLLLERLTCQGNSAWEMAGCMYLGNNCSANISGLVRMGGNTAPTDPEITITLFSRAYSCTRIRYQEPEE